MYMSFANDFEHKEALFQAALREFDIAGYEAASINKILSRASMSKGQFYYHFRNKEALYLALLENVIDIKASFFAKEKNQITFEEDIFSIFRAQVKLGFDFLNKRPEINAFISSFLREKGSAIYMTAMQCFNFDNDVAMYALIEAAYRRGEFKSGIPLTFIQKTVTHFFSHYADLIDPINEDVEENLSYLIEFMRSGLAK